MFKIIPSVGVVLIFGLMACTKGGESSTPVAPAPEVEEDVSSASLFTGGGEAKHLPNGMVIEDLAVGNGATASSGKTVVVHYIGTLDDGKKFDSSRDQGKPFSFKLGANQVIKGWDQGVDGMKVGGTRRMKIPPALAYGEAGTPGGPIPPNASLTFEVELIEIY